MDMIWIIGQVLRLAVAGGFAYVALAGAVGVARLLVLDFEVRRRTTENQRILKDMRSALMEKSEEKTRKRDERMAKTASPA